MPDEAIGVSVGVLQMEAQCQRQTIRVVEQVSFEVFILSQDLK